LPRLGGSLLQVVRNYMGADAATRESRKMGMMLTGAVVGLAPVTANVLIGLVSPSTFIPTSQYWFLALAAIPITFALAAVHGSAAAMATAGATAPATAAPAAEAPAAAAPPPAVPAAPAPDDEPMRTMSVGGSDTVGEEGTSSSEDEDPPEMHNVDE
jgi:hypothetical protein